MSKTNPAKSTLFISDSPIPFAVTWNKNPSSPPLDLKPTTTTTKFSQDAIKSNCLEIPSSEPHTLKETISSPSVVSTLINARSDVEHGLHSKFEEIGCMDKSSITDSNPVRSTNVVMTLGVELHRLPFPGRVHAPEALKL